MKNWIFYYIYFTGLKKIYEFYDVSLLAEYVRFEIESSDNLHGYIFLLILGNITYYLLLVIFSGFAKLILGIYRQNKILQKEKETHGNLLCCSTLIMFWENI